MTTYVRTLYDFSGEPNSSELSITAGEILTVSRTDVGEGWWEGTNSKGQIGLFPAAYVEYYSPVSNVNQANGGSSFSTTSTATAPVPPVLSSAPRYDQTSEDFNDNQDDWEDDWDDDNEYSEIGPGTFNSAQTQQKPVQQYNNNEQQGVSYANMNLPPIPTDDNVSVLSSNAQYSTVKKSGMFSKSSDSYILGTSNVAVPDEEKVFIIQNDNYYFWSPLSQPYTVRVASPKKETKFKGMKSFIAYQLTPSFNGIAVSRRYKHFDWLHERLFDKFSLIPIPPLPDKQISGRYEEEFIEHRRVQLQEFIDWVCRHPVLSICEVWRHFLTCTDDKKWKIGKRTAEKDTLVGFSYCAAIHPPEKQLLHSYVETQIESCTSFSQAMDAAVKNLFSAATIAKRNQLQSRKDYMKIGDCFSELARAVDIDERRFNSGISLSQSIGKTGGLFISISRMFEEQSKYDWTPLSDRLHIYRGILGSYPDLLSSHKGAVQKRKDCERLAAEQKMGPAQVVDVGRRVDVISYSVLAEMNHFRAERDAHLKKTMQDFIDSQIKFYQNVIAKLQDARHEFQ